VKRASEALKLTLRYRIVGDEKSSLAGKERLLLGGRDSFFPRLRNSYLPEKMHKRNQFKPLIVSS